MKLKFAKMHGLGNDFMVVDAINQAFSPRPDLVHQWSDRFDGIGFDQIGYGNPLLHQVPEPSALVLLLLGLVGLGNWGYRNRRAGR